MNRYGILIDAGGADENNPIKGTHLDIRNVADFLTSPLGGAWFQEELEVIAVPNTLLVLEKIERANVAHYVFFFFTGHGGYIGQKMSILLAPDDLIMVDAVIRRIRTRFTVAIDACGDHLDEVTSLELPESGRLLTEGRERVEEYRHHFDQAVANASTDRTVMYGCRRGQTAVGMSKSGGVFTNYLLNGAKRWSVGRRGEKPRVFTCREAIGDAMVEIGAAGYNQTPLLLSVSRQADLPIAVWLPPSRR